jgi:sugar transferase (PEP-CTERM/EpsH1 system associated)
LNVLFLSQRVPYPPDRGDRIATFNYLRHLDARGDRVRIGCLAETDADLDAAAVLAGRFEEICAVRIEPRLRKALALRGLATGSPLTLPYFADRRLRRSIAKWAADDPPDVVFVYSSSMAQYAIDLRGPVRLMYFAELDSDKWSQYAARRGVGPGRWVYAREARLLLEFERRVAHEFDAAAVVSEVEKRLFLERIPDVVPHVIPNGVDVEHFQSRGDASREPHTLIFTGVMDYEPNVDGVLWFVASAWPRVRASFPDARFLVVGSRPNAAIRALDGQAGVSVTGRVDTTPPWFDRATVAIAPLRLARGLQNKVLEAMSMGMPVVATTPAAQGLGAVPGDTLLVADQPERIADELMGLFRDPARARAVGSRAAAFVREHFLWAHTFEKLDVLLATERRAR